MGLHEEWFEYAFVSLDLPLEFGVSFRTHSRLFLVRKHLIQIEVVPIRAEDRSTKPAEGVTRHPRMVYREAIDYVYGELIARNPA
jgi:hypothetical protein